MGNTTKNDILIKYTRTNVIPVSSFGDHSLHCPVLMEQKLLPPNHFLLMLMALFLAHTDRLIVGKNNSDSR